MQLKPITHITRGHCIHNIAKNLNRSLKKQKNKKIHSIRKQNEIKIKIKTKQTRAQQTQLVNLNTKYKKQNTKNMKLNF